LSYHGIYPLEGRRKEEEGRRKKEEDSSTMLRVKRRCNKINGFVQWEETGFLI
jgi:hypothetical protein